MNDDFSLRASIKTDEDLQKSIDNREDYLPETVEAAQAELQSRGVTFSDEELRVIAEDMQTRRNLAMEKSDTFGMFSNRDVNNIIKDPDAPSLYTRRAIYVFSVLFSTLFGSVMLAINVSKTPNKSKAIIVVLFGLGYTVIMALISQNFNLNSSFTIVTALAGAYILEALFWNRYIGNTTLYRVRQIWVALIVALAIVIPVIVILFMYGPK